jgi:hypothetical protein
MKIPENSVPFGPALQPRASTRTNVAGRAREMSPQEKNLRDLSGSLQSLRTQLSPKQQAAGRVGWLKRRLETMKAMLQFATPAQAKHLVRELKGIAKELASVARSLNTMDGGTLAGTVAFSVDAAQPDAADASAPDAAQAAEQAQAAAGEAAQAAAEARTAQSEAVAAGVAAETAMADEMDEANETGEADGPDEGHGMAAASSGATASDQSLRQALTETARLIREILDRLKTMLTDKDGRKVAAETEKILVDLKRELSRGADTGVYGAQGVPVSVAEPAFAGIDVNA